MSLEGRLKKLAETYHIPLTTVVKRYEGRYNALKMAYGKEYTGRDSHLRFHAYQGTALSLDAEYKKNKLEGLK